MGQYADDIVEGRCDWSGDYTYKDTVFVKDTPAQAKIRAVRKELAILIKEKQSHCTTEKEKNSAVNLARQEINAKYGKGWREEY